MITAEPPVLDELLDPIRDCLTTEVAAKIVALRANAKTQAKLDEFAEKNKEGTLTPKEQIQYDSYIRAIDLISILQAKARRVLSDGL